MPADLKLLISQLSELLGAENVLQEGESIVVKPASAGETAEVVDFACRENIPVEPANYAIGPDISPGPGVKIILSLERMNKIRHFDRESLSMFIDPAAAADEIIKAATDCGAFFPGKYCCHQMPTVGENVAACFKKGNPRFRCISGMEMAMLDGGVVTVDGSLVKDEDSYNLPYLLSGNSDNRAVIIGMHLRLLPASSSEIGIYLLVATFTRPKDAFDMASALPEYCGSLKKVIAFDASFAFPPSDYLINLFPGQAENGAYVLFSIEDEVDRLDAAAREIAEACQRQGAHEVLIAAATYQKEAVDSAFKSILAGFAAANDFHGDPGPEPRRLKALVWQADPAKKFYYITE